jgi:hypothetical protein
MFPTDAPVAETDPTTLKRAITSTVLNAFARLKLPSHRV